MNAQSIQQIIAVFLSVTFSCVAAGCSRDHSRIVRRVVKNTLLPIYDELGLQMPTSCSVHPSRNMYEYQEENKEMETITKWACNFCGKAFFEEYLLDQHFHNRHQTTLNTNPNAVCLDDWCNIFRCDVVAGRKKPDYWDHALCRETDFDNINRRCHELMKECLPSNIPPDKKDKLLEKLDNAICDFLNCDKYYELPAVEIPHPSNAALYAIAFMFLAIGVLIYYYVAYIHYYTNENIFDQINLNTENKETYYRRKSNIVRQRTKVFR